MSQKNKIGFTPLSPELNVLVSESLLCITSIRLRVGNVFSFSVKKKPENIIKDSVKLL